MRVGLVAGFAVGYYLGAKAGRERYEQLRELLGEVGDSRLFEKLEALIELSVERLRGASHEEDTLRLLGTPLVGDPPETGQVSSR